MSSPSWHVILENRWTRSSTKFSKQNIAPELKPIFKYFYQKSTTIKKKSTSSQNDIRIHAQVYEQPLELLFTLPIMATTLLNGNNVFWSLLKQHWFLGKSRTKRLINCLHFFHWACKNKQVNITHDKQWNDLIQNFSGPPALPATVFSYLEPPDWIPQWFQLGWKSKLLTAGL